ncbi:MAG: MBL fold metallo-hydrolase [Anaerolineales bacterium]|nr:MBL fold metallo-hydrolase [Anaerolineales bacterium]MCB8963245.1 MBL fold metallo-hydrolase [Ardenticatenales bacterium]
MQLHLLGTGTPILDPERPASSAFLVDVAGATLLFDAGRGVTMQLLKLGRSPVAIDYLFITHHHYDHICDLGELLMAAWHNGRTAPLHVYGPAGTRSIVKALLDGVFARDIAFARVTEPEGPNIHDLIQVTDITAPWHLATDAFRIRAVYVNHGNSLGLSVADWPCLGYRLEAVGRVLAVGGDAVACEGLSELAEGADALLLSCYLAESEVVGLGFELLAEHVIASAGMCGQIAADAGVATLILTHFRRKSAELMAELARDVAHRFGGKLILGSDLQLIEI